MSYIDYTYLYSINYYPLNYTHSKSGSPLSDQLEGRAYNDWLYGNDGHDTLIGNAGDDYLHGGAGIDYINGGMGNDIYHYTISDIISSTQPYVQMNGTSYVQADNIDMPTGDFSLNIKFRINENTSGTIFSYATPDNANELTVAVLNGSIITNIDGNFNYKGATVSSLDWHDFTVTYAQNTGQLTVYDNGIEMVSQTLEPGTGIDSGGILISGQEQDTYGGGFNSAEALSGEVGQITIWDSPLSTSEIASPDTSTSIHHYDFSNINDGEIVDITGNNPLTIMLPSNDPIVDQIYDREGFDVLRFDNGIFANDITAQINLSSPTSVDLLYQGQIFTTIQGQFDNFNSGIDLLQFYDGTEINLEALVQNPRDSLPETVKLEDNEFGHNWGGIDDTIYRGTDYAGREEHNVINQDNTTQLNISVGTSVAEIHNMISQVSLDEHLILHFEAGEHSFNEQLLINRGNITLEGSGENLTTFVANFPEGQVTNLIVVRGEDNSIVGQWKDYLSDYIGTITQEFNYGDHQITLSDTTGLNAGDTIMVTNSGQAGDDQVAYSSMAQIKEVNGNNLILEHKLAFNSYDRSNEEALSDIKIYKTALLENVTLQDFSVRYDGQLSSNYDRFFLENYNSQFAQNDTESGAELGWGFGPAVIISGTHEAHINNINITQAGSTGFAFISNLETLANELVVADTLNRGSGGNGYGIEYYQSYYGDFHNLEFGMLRHGLTASIDGSSGFNNFHIKYSQANADFHGGDDRGNIYYIEDMISMPITEEDRGDDNLISINLIDYRNEDNIDYNTVIFDRATALDMTFAGDTYVDPYLGHEILVASNNGAYINAGIGNDMLISGSGNDTFVGGSGEDTFQFSIYNGIDEILDFENNDIISLLLSTSSTLNAEDILNNAQQIGHDLVLSLSAGHEIRLAYKTIDDLKSEQIHIIKTIPNIGEVFTGTNINEAFYGNSNNDTVDYSNGAAINIDLTNNTASGGFASGDTLTNIENIIGSDLSDSAQRDWIWGDENINHIQGMGGADILEGGAGEDIIDGGAGWDYARYIRSDAGVNINLETGVNTGGHAQGDTLINIEAIVGSMYDDIIHGGKNNDYLKGAAGNDIIAGGNGIDQLYGGSRLDTFLFNAITAFNDIDHIRDFNIEDNDIINISDLLTGYNDITDAITNFVQITDNGTNSILAIDTDGGSNNFISIATIYGVTGITDEEALEKSGHLVTI